MGKFLQFYVTNRRHGVEKFELDFDPEHTTPARVFRACLPWRAMVVCPETDRKVRRRFLARRLYIIKSDNKVMALFIAFLTRVLLTTS